MQIRSSHIFFFTCLIGTILLFFGGDKIITYFYPGIEEKYLLKTESIYLDFLNKTQNKNLIRAHSPGEAKSKGLFWAANIQGKGFGLDLLSDPALINSLFPGYGELLFKDQDFWRAYFKREFGPDSFMKLEQDLLKLEFRVTYSWTGCLKLYEKHGADVLVLGSSEVYKDLIPSLLAKDLSKLFPKPPKVLFCVAPAMSVEAVIMTSTDLLRLQNKKPKIIIWGYSFWSAYTNSKKIAEYQIEKNKQINKYLSDKRIQEGSILYKINSISELKGADFFPKIDWNNIVQLTFDKVRSYEAEQGGKAAEGVHIQKSVLDLDDQHLSAYLWKNLLPYYEITQGVTEKDCIMNSAKSEIEIAIKSLKLLSTNIYIYLTPTTEHHRKTVPPCFLPNVSAMLENISRQEEVNILVKNMESYNLSNRDFIHPTLREDNFYFDINHANYQGAQKITKTISDWINSKLINQTDFLIK
jgi:hypothetical protein